MNEKPRFARKRIVSAQLRASTGVRGVGGEEKRCHLCWAEGGFQRCPA